jgi:hypothetical protein
MRRAVVQEEKLCEAKGVVYECDNIVFRAVEVGGGGSTGVESDGERNQARYCHAHLLPSSALKASSLPLALRLFSLSSGESAASLPGDWVCAPAVKEDSVDGDAFADKDCIGRSGSLEVGGGALGGGGEGI